MNTDGQVQKIVLATANPGKVRELNALLGGLGLQVMPQSALQVSEIEETGLSFVENAILKARHAARCTGLPAIADDSGLAVDALGGAPGIYSARYAGPDASDEKNLRKVLADLRDVPDAKRTARFQCLLVYLRHAEDPTPLICQGIWEGMVVHEPRGDNGFGYDPIFFVPSEAKTAAEIEPEVKNRLSHRGQALAQLVHRLVRKPGRHY